MCSKVVRMCSFLMVSMLLLASAAQAADPSLIGWWPFDEDSGVTAFDFSGNGNDGTLSDNTSFVPGAGRWGGAVLYDGTDTAHVEVSAANMSASAGTVLMWANLSDPQPAQTRYFFGHTTQPSYNNRIQLYMDGTTELDLGLGDAHARQTDIVTLNTQQWYYVGLTWNNGSYVVYLDGEAVATGSYTGLSDIHDIVWIGNDGNPDSQGTEGFGGMLDEARIYNRALTQEEVQVAMRTAAGFGLAGDPDPANGATDVLRDAVLNWMPGEFAVAHDVYFGTAYEDVNDASRTNPMDVLVSQGQTAATYDPEGLLEFSQTYYWRIDEVNAAPDNTIFKGEVWSFTAEAMAYPIEGVVATSNAVSDEISGPENVVNGSGLNEDDQHSTAAEDMWLGSAGADPVWIQFEFDKVYKLYELLVWNYNIQFEPVLGFGVKDVTIEYSVDGVEWMTLGDAQFAQATATPTYIANTAVDLAGVAARFVRLDVTSGYGILGQYGLSEVRFMYIPVQAREPEPADGATDVDPATELSWRAGREAVSHDVYLGTDSEALALVDSTSETMSAADLEFGTTYYWRIDEIGDVAWEGDLWSFSTLEYVLIDGFETYNDDVEAMTTIFDTWVDGWVNGNGSTVGYFDAPFAEQTIVRSGKQSMPLQYDNSASPFYSEATRTFDSPLDWTGNGADSLVLYVQGAAPAFAETGDGGAVMSAIGADIWGTADQGNFAYKSLSGDGSIVARVDSIYQSNDWAKGGVMIRETLDAGSTHALVAVTPVNGVAFQDRPAADGESFNVNQGGLTAPYWVKLTRTGNTFTAERSEDGVNWVSITEDAAASSVTIPMAANVYIGLVLTSHDAAVATDAAFSNIATTGNVTGQWQTAAIGVAQPEGGNDPASLYVKIEDSSGKVAVATNPDAAITVKGNWNEWRIPFSDLADVNLSRVEAMTIGVGSPTNPTADGTGIIYIDDISYGKPAE